MSDLSTSNLEIRPSKVFFQDENGLKERKFEKFLDAQNFYNSISEKHAKALWLHDYKEEFFASASWNEWKDRFTDEIKQIAVLWDDGKINEMRFVDYQAALNYYHTISKEYAKIKNGSKESY